MSNNTERGGKESGPMSSLSSAYEVFSQEGKVEETFTRWFGLYRILFHPTSTFSAQRQRARWGRVFLILGAFTLVRVGLFVAQQRISGQASSLLIDRLVLWQLLGIPIFLVL